MTGSDYEPCVGRKYVILGFEVMALLPRLSISQPVKVWAFNVLQDRH